MVFNFWISPVSTCFLTGPNSTPLTLVAKFNELIVSLKSLSDGLICTNINAFESPPAGKRVNFENQESNGFEHYGIVWKPDFQQFDYLMNLGVDVSAWSFWIKR